MLSLFVISVALQYGFNHAFVLNPKIIGGIVSKTNYFPFFVNIVSKDHPICGGSLISDRWIVTAAHCIRQNVPVYIDIGIGPNGTFEKSMRIDTSQQHIYPAHSKALKSYDIGLIELPKPIHFTHSIQPAILPQNCNDDHEMEDVITVGNGRTDVKHRANDTTLRHGYSQTIPHQHCAAALKDNPDPNSVICAISKTQQNIFKGDSGGPLVRKEDGSLIGISSLALKRKNSDDIHLQVFTKLSYFFGWISMKTGLILPRC